MLTLTHEEQQKAADKIHELMANGMSSGQAIKQIADEIRAAAGQQHSTDNEYKYEEEEEEEEEDQYEENEERYEDQYE